jgi:hypothetical protein
MVCMHASLLCFIIPDFGIRIEDQIPTISFYGDLQVEITFYALVCIQAIIDTIRCSI